MPVLLIFENTTISQVGSKLGWFVPAYLEKIGLKMNFNSFILQNETQIYGR